MSIKEIKEAIESEQVYFGIRQTLRNSKNLKSVFISKDARDETVDLLETAEIEFSVLKPKSELTKELNLDFESEIFSIHSGKKSSKKE